MHPDTEINISLTVFTINIQAILLVLTRLLRCRLFTSIRYVRMVSELLTHWQVPPFVLKQTNSISLKMAARGLLENCSKALQACCLEVSGEAAACRERGFNQGQET